VVEDEVDLVEDGATDVVEVTFGEMGAVSRTIFTNSIGDSKEVVNTTPI
jgi:hypothetical protein